MKNKDEMPVYVVQPRQIKELTDTIKLLKMMHDKQNTMTVITLVMWLLTLIVVLTMTMVR